MALKVYVTRCLTVPMSFFGGRPAEGNPSPPKYSSRNSFQIIYRYEMHLEGWRGRGDIAVSHEGRTSSEISIRESVILLVFRDFS
jgi:hypothetical protein